MNARQEYLDIFRNTTDEVKKGQIALADFYVNKGQGSETWSLYGQNPEVINKGTLTLADLNTGGGNVPEAYQREFTRLAFERPGILSDVRRETGISPQFRVPKLAVNSIEWLPSSQDITANTADYDGREFKEAAVSEPTMSFVELNVFETQVVIKIPKEFLEDNVEQGGFANTLMGMVAEHLGTRMEALLINGDTTLGTSTPTEKYFRLRDGILKKITSNVVDNANGELTSNSLSAMYKALADQYKVSNSGLKYYFSKNIAEDVAQQMSARFTALGDNILTSASTVLPFRGRPVTGIDVMPNDQGMLINPNNIIVYVRRDMEIETKYEPEERLFYYVATARWDFNLEDELNSAKIINVAEISA